MDITVTINDETLDEPVRKAVAQAVNQVVRDKAHQAIANYRGEIEQAIEKYIAKNIDDEKIKSMINSEIVEILSERIRNL